MKLGDVLILSLALALIIIGIHQALTVGITGSYAIFMMAVGLLFWFQLRKNSNPVDSKPDSRPETKKKKR
ncbi:hypothetical protein [Algoriphagus confluentis]|uniref:Uncharacterized protein n=1 Tax=Algoriphagus confluentis TaxID=1697556 RepID=A0ABQ6PQ12_9BACT|nr:hypothetical protein Aconfl_26690 [Algoriphagus confluentis]